MGEALEQNEEAPQERRLRLVKMGEKIQEGLRHFDAWSNNVTGLGTSFDKAQHTSFGRKSRIPDQKLSDLFHGDDLSRRVVSITPKEMTRKGHILKVPEINDDAKDGLLTETQRLNVNRTMQVGLTWGGLYGGAAGVLGIRDGRDSREPVDEENIQGVDFINIVDKRYLQPVEWQNDPMQPDFGEPLVYRITPRTAVGMINGSMTVEVHRSRLLIFPGVLTSDDERANNDGWDFSKLQTILPVIRDFQSTWLAVGNLIQEASVGVYKVKDLIGLIASKQQNVVTQRLQMIDISKSVARSIAIDADNEEYSRIGAQLTELSKLLDRYMLRLSSAVEIPVTILMGQSPAGMNATGDADFRWYYDNVATDQTNILKPLLVKLYRYIFLAKEGPTGGEMPKSFDVIFTPLWAMSPKEQAEVEKLIAEKDSIYIDKGVQTSEETGLSRYTPEGWRMDTTIDREAREDSIKKQREAAKSNQTEKVALELAPTDIAKVVTVNEARASQGLGPMADEEAGSLSVFEFAAKAQSGSGGVAASPQPEGVLSNSVAPGSDEEEEPQTPNAPDATDESVDEEEQE